MLTPAVMKAVSPGRARSRRLCLTAPRKKEAPEGALRIDAPRARSGWRRACTGLQATTRQRCPNRAGGGAGASAAASSVVIAPYAQFSPTRQVLLAGVHVTGYEHLGQWPSPNARPNRCLAEHSKPRRSLQPIGDDVSGDLNEPAVTKLNQPDVACVGQIDRFPYTDRESTWPRPAPATEVVGTARGLAGRWR